VPSSGKLFDGAHVKLMRSSPTGFVALSRITRDGAFALADVPPGNYTLEALSIPASAMEEIARSGRSDPLTSGNNLELGMMSIVVSGVDVGDVVIAMSPAGRIRGRVKIDGGRAGALVLSSDAV
jgi:hypothetical protein